MPTNCSRTIRALATASAGLLILGASATGWAAVRAQLERSTVKEGETLTLSIESDAAQSSERPELAPLRKDFEVLGTSTSNETSIVNGARSDRTRWLVRLLPRHPGSLAIPAITVGSEHTEPLALDVTKATPQAANRASTHAFMEIEAAAGNSIYVQQQVSYAVRLFYDESVQSGEIAAPDAANAVVEQLGDDERYSAIRGGRQYSVIERHYAISPERSGVLRIPSATFRGSVVAAQSPQADTNRVDDLMASMLRGTPFANSSFFNGAMGAGMAFGEPAQPVVVRGREVTLDVRPRPAGAHGDWLPAEQITLHDSWQDNPPHLRAGEPATRTITISAKGLAASQIAPLALAAPRNARLYADTPDAQSRTDGKTIYGISKQSVTYVPTAQGTLDVPPIELAWWDTGSNTQSRATLPAREFTVAAGAAGGQADATPPASPVAGTAATKPNAGNHAGQGESSSGTLGEKLRGILQGRRAWLAGAAASLAMAILALAAVRRSRRRGPRTPQDTTAALPAPRRRPSLRTLQQACAGNDRQAAARALLDLARAEWPDAPPRGLGALAARIEAGGEEVCALDKSLYGAGGSDWQGSALWEAVRRGLKPKRNDIPREDDGLGALYHGQ